MSNTGLIYIQGRLFPKTVEGIISSAEHIYDPNIQLDGATEVGAYQTSINEALKNMATSTKSLVDDKIELVQIVDRNTGDGPELEFYKSNEDHIYIKISDILSGLESIDDESIDNLFV